MLKKEFKDVLRQTAYFLGLTLMMAVVVRVAMWSEELNFTEMYWVPMQIALLIFAFFLGNSLFLGERRQRAMDYMMALPYSKMQIILNKLIPRFIAAAVLYLLYLPILKMGMSEFIALPISPIAFTYLYFAVFIISATLSPISGNHFFSSGVTLFVIALFPIMLKQLFHVAMVVKTGTAAPLSYQNMFTVTLFHFRNLGGMAGVVQLMLICLLLLLPFVIALVWAFKRVGAQPASAFNKRFLSVFAPLFAVSLAISFGIAHSMLPPAPSYYYLTRNHTLLESRGTRTTIHQNGNQTKVDGIFVPWTHYAVEYNNKMIALSRRNENEVISLLDLPTHKVETLYTAPTGVLVNSIGGGENDIAVLESNTHEKEIILTQINIGTKAVKKVKLPGPGKFRSYFIIGSRFIGNTLHWIITPISKIPADTLMVNASGHIITLQPTHRFAIYEGGKLITFENDRIHISTINETGAQLEASLPYDPQINFFPFRHAYFSTAKKGSIFGSLIKGNQKRLYRLDLENPALEELTWLTEYFKNQPKLEMEYLRILSTEKPILYYHGQLDENNRTHYIKRFYSLDLSAQKLTLQKEYKYQYSPSPTQSLYYNIHGLIYRNKNQTEIHTFPDFQEVTVPNL